VEEQLKWFDYAKRLNRTRIQCRSFQLQFEGNRLGGWLRITGFSQVQENKRKYEIIQKIV
jgi:hypothetical protein